MPDPNDQHIFHSDGEECRKHTCILTNVCLRQISNQRHNEQEMSALLIAMLEVDWIYITYTSTCILIVLVINMYIIYNKTVINYEYCNLHTTQCMIIIKEYPCQ